MPISLPVRLRPGADLRRALEDIARREAPEGCFVVAGIGSLLQPRLRFAGQQEATSFDGPFEILSLSGSVADGVAHLHMAISSASGSVHGGHVVYGNEVRTTVEMLLQRVPGQQLAREHDPQTGFLELVVRPGSGAP